MERSGIILTKQSHIDGSQTFDMRLLRPLKLSSVVSRGSQ